MMLVCLTSGRDDTSSGRMKERTDGHPDGMARSSGRLTGNLNFFRLVDSEKVESMFTASLHLSDFVQTQNETKILTNSPFGYSGTKIT